MGRIRGGGVLFLNPLRGNTGRRIDVQGDGEKEAQNLPASRVRPTYFVNRILAILTVKE